MFAFGGALSNVLAFAIADKQFRFVSRPAKPMTRQQTPAEAFCPRFVNNWDTRSRFNRLVPQFSIGTEGAYAKP
jgi:hypothetical protein